MIFKLLFSINLILGGVWGKGPIHSFTQLKTSTESALEHEKSTTTEPYSVTIPLITTQTPNMDDLSNEMTGDKSQLMTSEMHILPSYPCPVQPEGYFVGGPPNCQCVMKGQCTMSRREATKLLLPQTNLVCGLQYEPCCYADSPYPGSIDIYEGTLPCVPQERCIRSYGQSSLDIAQFGTLNPCPGAGAVRCLDHLRLPALPPPPPPQPAPIAVEPVFPVLTGLTIPSPPVPVQVPVPVEPNVQNFFLSSFPCPVQPEGFVVGGPPNCHCVQRGQCTIGRMEITKVLLPKSDLVCGDAYEPCCFKDSPYPGFLDIFGSVLACVPQEKCIRFYGASPTDIRDFGTLSPCPGAGAVRCLDALGIPPYVPPQVIPQIPPQVIPQTQVLQAPAPLPVPVSNPLPPTTVALEQPIIPPTAVAEPLPPSPPVGYPYGYGRFGYPYYRNGDNRFAFTGISGGFGDWGRGVGFNYGLGIPRLWPYLGSFGVDFDIPWLRYFKNIRFSL